MYIRSYLSAVAISALMLPAGAGAAIADKLATSNEPSFYRIADRSLYARSDKEKGQLDALYEELARDVNEKSAQRTSRKISQILTRSGSDTVDLLMEAAAGAMMEKNYSIALDLLDQVTTLAPDYPEGWNRRATLYFARKDFNRSLRDVEQVLKLEPRHIGALSGLAIMLGSLDKKEESLTIWYKILTLYPANEAAQKAVLNLEDQLSGNPT